METLASIGTLAVVSWKWPHGSLHPMDGVCCQQGRRSWDNSLGFGGQFHPLVAWSSLRVSTYQLLCPV